MPKSIIKKLPEVLICSEGELLLLNKSDIIYFVRTENKVTCYTYTGLKYDITKTFGELILMPLFSTFLVFGQHYFVNEKYLESIITIEGDTIINIRAKAPLQIPLNKKSFKPVLMQY